MEKRRVVVTGLGIVAPVGIGVTEAWSNIVAGRSGITRITRFDPSGLRSQIAGEGKGLDVTRSLPPAAGRRMDTFAHCGLAPAVGGIKDAGFRGRRRIVPAQRRAYAPSAGLGRGARLFMTVQARRRSGNGGVRAGRGARRGELLPARGLWHELPCAPWQGVLRGLGRSDAVH